MGMNFLGSLEAEWLDASEPALGPAKAPKHRGSRESNEMYFLSLLISQGGV